MRMRATVFMALLGLVGCGEDAADPGDLSMAAVAADYGAGQDYGTWELTTTENDSTVDWLARGAFVEITLSEDGTTTGRAFIPGADEDGSDFDEDLAGTWTLSNGVVEFSHEADTFIRDMPFTVDGDRLVGEEVFSDTRVRMVLVRR